MKKIAYVLIASILLLVGASLASQLIVAGSEDVFFGVGTYASASDLAASESEKDGEIVKSNGKSELAVTVMAITVNREGTILNCSIDSVNAAVGYTDTGVAVVDADFPTKREQGYGYNMSKYGIYQDYNGDGVVLEWFEQADAFESVVIGKKLDEIDALLAEGGRGNDELIASGCTIAISDFIYAFNNARDELKLTDAKSTDDIKLGIHSASSKITNATADASGGASIDVNIFGATVDANGRVTAAMSDAVGYSAAFDREGKPMSESSASIQMKRAMRYDYNMSAYGSDLNGDGVVLEWFEQADAFDNSVIGLNGGELFTLIYDTGYGKDTLVSAGCTINVWGFIKAAAKALK